MNRKQHRLEAIMMAKQKISLNPVYLDAETTGTGELDEIIEIAIVDYDGTILIDSFVQPIGNISPEAYAIHGITNDVLNDAPTWVEVWHQVKDALQGRVVGIYNADFDIRMMQQTHQISGMDWHPPFTGNFCIMKLYAQFYGEWNPSARDYRWQKLDTARWQTNLKIPNSHRAKDDTLLARALLHYIAEQSS
jgi:DNA polymerase-3 subunit epsilon